MGKKRILVLIILINVFICNYLYVNGNEDNAIHEEKKAVLTSENVIYWEDVINTGKDNGFSKKMDIKLNDPHYGWKLGKFVLSGFSGKRRDDNGNWIFLKNVGDDITLYFNLAQDINNLDGKKELKISEDKNGYDNEFNIRKTNFGRGCLIVRKIDSTGNKNEPEIYTDYLNGVTVGANTKINVYEEGDYEVALDYEVLEDNGFVFKDYNNYRIRFNFSIRNGNCMVFPFDVKTKRELNNTAFTENGFYLDLANSQYLEINVKREVFKEDIAGLVEDVRFNRPAKSGEAFTEDGIYTITVKNNYTHETTIKKIYVGKNNVLKAVVQTGKNLEEIKDLLKSGANIDDEGIITNMPHGNKIVYSNNKSNKSNNGFITFIVLVFVFVAFIMIRIIKYIKIKKVMKNRLNSKLIQLNAEIEKVYKLNDNYIHFYLTEDCIVYELYDLKFNLIKTSKIDYPDVEEDITLKEIKEELSNKLDIPELRKEQLESISLQQFNKLKEQKNGE